jgi:hypothetical protein
MAFDTKSDLKTKAASWLKRTGNATYEAQVDDFIILGESKMNREIGGPIENEAARTGTIDSRAVSISALSIVEPLSLFIADPGGTFDELPLQKQTPSNLPAIATSGKPTMWVMDSTTNIKFERPCDQAYAFRFRFRGKAQLAADGDTNWLLQNHPDAYLEATLLWGAEYLEWGEHADRWKRNLRGAIVDIKAELGRRNSGTMRADPALLAMGGGRGSFNINRGE